MSSCLIRRFVLVIAFIAKAGCSSSDVDDSPDDTNSIPDSNTPVSSVTFNNIPGDYINLDFNMRYKFDGASLTLQSYDVSDEFQTNGNRIRSTDDICISVSEIDFSSATFKTNSFGTTPIEVSPPSIAVARVNQISLASPDSFRYYGYDETAGESAEINVYLTAIEWDNYHSGFTYFGNPSDTLGYNLPLGMCLQGSQPDQFIDFVLIALSATDGASIRIRPFPNWDEYY